MSENELNPQLIYVSLGIIAGGVLKISWQVSRIYRMFLKWDKEQEEWHGGA